MKRSRTVPSCRPGARARRWRAGRRRPTRRPCGGGLRRARPRRAAAPTRRRGSGRPRGARAAGARPAAAGASGAGSAGSRARRPAWAPCSTSSSTVATESPTRQALQGGRACGAGRAPTSRCCTAAAIRHSAARSVRAHAAAWSTAGAARTVAGRRAGWRSAARRVTRCGCTRTRATDGSGRPGRAWRAADRPYGTATCTTGQRADAQARARAARHRRTGRRRRR